MLHYQVVRTPPGGATLSNKMNNTMHYRHVMHTLALMCAKNHLLIFSSFVDIWENVEWPRFFRTTLYIVFGKKVLHLIFGHNFQRHQRGGELAEIYTKEAIW